MAELRLERLGDLREEVGLGDLAPLELEERVLAVGLGDRLHRLAEDFGVIPVSSWNAMND